MPNFDKTGPTGKGPKTGGQMGDCEDAKQEVKKPFDGRGRGMGRCCDGRPGRGMRGRFGRQNDNE